MDIRADIYSLGCTLYFLLSGRLVFEAESFAQKMVYHQLREPTPLREVRPQVPAGLEVVVQRMMVKDPAGRFATPAEAAAALAAWSVPPPGPPDSAMMPKLAAGVYRLGLCSPPSSVSVARPESPQTPESVPFPPAGEPGNAPAETARNSGQDTPRAEPSFVLPGPAPHPPRRTVWLGGAAGLLAAAAVVAVALWPTRRPPADPSPGHAQSGEAAAQSPAKTPVPIKAIVTGGGSTFLAPAMRHWSKLYEQKTGVQIHYQEIGSGGGVKGVTAGILEFGATDAPMTDEQLAAAAAGGREVFHVPLVMGAVVPTYNLPGIGQLRFTGPLLADIYLGKVTRWNDAALRANNPGVDLPDLPVAVVRRGETSGTTFIWTDFLSRASAEWRGRVGVGTAVTWAVGADAKGNDGVADAVSRKIGAIGYVELSYAVANNLSVGVVKNREGTYVVPSFESVTAAAAALLKDIPDDLRYPLTDAPGKDSYPISGTAWALVPVPKGGKPQPEVIKFLEWATHEGQKSATEMRYAQLPPPLVLRIDAMFYRLNR